VRRKSKEKKRTIYKRYFLKITFQYFFLVGKSINLYQYNGCSPAISGPFTFLSAVLLLCLLTCPIRVLDSPGAVCDVFQSQLWLLAFQSQFWPWIYFSFYNFNSFIILHPYIHIMYLILFTLHHLLLSPFPCPLIPPPKYFPFTFISLLVYIPHIRENMWYLSFWVWLV
jgi:hypothetical protein